MYNMIVYKVFILIYVLLFHFSGLNDVAEVFLRQPRQQSEIQDGGTFTLKCEVSGNPEPEIEWYRNRIR